MLMRAAVAYLSPYKFESRCTSLFCFCFPDGLGKVIALFRRKLKLRFVTRKITVSLVCSTFLPVVPDRVYHFASPCVCMYACT